MRKGFTLVELIFVIVIIGVLAAVAVPKFKSLKQSAEASGVVKTAVDGFASIAPSYVNLVDLENTYTNDSVTLQNLVKISGKGWTYANDKNTSYYKDGANTVVTISLGADRSATLTIDCSNFADSLTSSKCESLVEDNSTISF